MVQGDNRWSCGAIRILVERKKRGWFAIPSFVFYEKPLLNAPPKRVSVPFLEDFNVKNERCDNGFIFLKL